MSIESVMPSNHLILCHSLLLLPSIFPRVRVFSNESVLRIRWPKDWSFSFSVSPSSEHPGLISFRIDWFDHLVVQGTLKSLFQHHSSKVSIILHSAFFVAQLSHPYMTIELRYHFLNENSTLLQSCDWLQRSPQQKSYIVSSFHPISSWCIFQWTRDNLSLQEK